MAKKKTILDAVYIQYNKQTNMTLKELRAWAKTKLSTKASLNRRPINMAIRLKAKPRSKWNLTDIKWAIRKAIPYLKRAKKIKGGAKIKGSKYTRKEVALKNWGYDVKKKRRK